MVASHREPGLVPRPPDAGGYRVLSEAAAAHPEAPIVSIAVPGLHAAFVAQRALDAGRHVFLFSGNVERQDEIDLKQRALELGLLVMGPDCSTAIVAGVGFGFSNRVPRGPVGIVGTSGSAVQEVACGLALLGVGLSHAIGTGSRDLAPGVDGVMTEAGLRLLAADLDTRVLVLLAGHASDEQASRLLELCATLGKPVVVRFLGRAARGGGGTVSVATDLDDAARLAASLAQGQGAGSRPVSPDVGSRAAALLGRRTKIEGRMVGLFAGGSRAREAQLILRESGVEAALADRPLVAEGKFEGEGNLLVDVGADFFTIHYPHPLVDQRLRCALSAKAAADPAVELLLFDLALGDGVHPDPGPELVEAISSGRHQRGDAPLVVVASVCGTDADPQGAARQRSALAEAGVQIVASASGAARLCAALKAGARGGVT